MRTLCFTLAAVDTADAARSDAAKGALETAQKLEANSPETLLALGYYQFWVLQDYALAKTTFSRVSKLLPGSSEVPYALARVAQYEGHLDQSVAYYEQALALDPRNVELLNDTAWNIRHASTTAGRAKALRSSAGYHAKRSEYDGGKGRHLSG